LFAKKRAIDQDDVILESLRLNREQPRIRDLIKDEL
jgi:hypothetical protein